MSLSEYADRLDAVFQEGIAGYETLVASPEGSVLIAGQGSHLSLEGDGSVLTDFTPQDLHVALVKVAELQDRALEMAHDIDPPDQLEELHVLFFRQLPITELAERARTAATWEELSASPEMAAYRDGLERDNQTCAEFQATLDATADRGAFVDAPWMPGRLTEIIDYGLACDGLPSNPQDVYRP